MTRPISHLMFAALKGSQFYFFLLLLQLVLCRVAAQNRLPVHHSYCRLFWSFQISECILRNQNIIIGLDSFSNQRLIYLALFGLGRKSSCASTNTTDPNLQILLQFLKDFHPYRPLKFSDKLTYDLKDLPTYRPGLFSAC